MRVAREQRPSSRVILRSIAFVKIGLIGPSDGNAVQASAEAMIRDFVNLSQVKDHVFERTVKNVVAGPVAISTESVNGIKDCRGS
jgi:hypothetical protein